MIYIMYEKVCDVPKQVEAERLATMATSTAWVQPQHQMIARLIALNGLGATLWCCAPLTLEMLHALRDEEPPPGMLT